ncbi:MAG TPA: PIG-L deacetylase family protein [Candidatus Angelobacter sp.]|nr:PIG-L deacetylase family protein [Candidatus Angelobacter sp.]
MRSLTFPDGPAAPMNILCLGAHSDDIEIGCGGTILRFREQYPHWSFHWVVFSAIGVRETEARRGATLFGGATPPTPPLLKTFRDGFMPFVGAEVKEVFEDLKQMVRPDLIFTHSHKDAHQDHRLISELTWNTFRDQLILEFEVPKYDGDLGQPGLFVTLSSEHCAQKVRYLMDTFRSQRCRRWFREDTFTSLMRLRGMECNSDSGYAEAFYCRKLVL